MSRKELLVIDRIEDDLAIIAHGSRTFSLPCNLLPRAAKEGDVIKLAVALDTKAIAQRKKEARSQASKAHG